MIRFHRPDLLSTYTEHHSEIPLNPPQKHFAGIIDYYAIKYIIVFIPDPSIPGVGELMLASFPSTTNFEDTIAPKTPWYYHKVLSILIFTARWIGEKYDGIRFCWNPEEQEMYIVLNIIFTGPFVSCTDILAMEFLLHCHICVILMLESFWMVNFGMLIGLNIIKQIGRFGRGQFSESHKLIHSGNFDLISWAFLR